MEKLVVDRRASENPYLHRDFHISTDLSLAYVGKQFGQQGVREYLQQYASAYYRNLVERISLEGLAALEQYFVDIYAAEQASDALETELAGHTLHVRISYSPGIRYMKSKGHTPSPWQQEVPRIIYAALANTAGLEFHLACYDSSSGAAELIFSRKKEQST